MHRGHAGGAGHLSPCHPHTKDSPRVQVSISAPVREGRQEILLWGRSSVSVASNCPGLRQKTLIHRGDREPAASGVAGADP